MIFQIGYHLILFIALIILGPIHLVRLLFQEKYRSSTLPRLGFQKVPTYQQDECIWIHSVSLGETIIAGQIAKTIKAKDPDIKVLVSTCTETGKAEAEKCAAIDDSIYYPLDIYFLIQVMFSAIKPKAILIMETDLWPNMLSIAKQQQVPVYLLNGKISESSHSTYRQMAFIPKRLLDPIDHIYAQCETYVKRFLDLGFPPKQIEASGNLKLDRTYPERSDEEKQNYLKSLGLDPEKPVIVFASTHDGEEQMALSSIKALTKTHTDAQFIIVPRHPERFARVENLLKESGMPFHKFSSGSYQDQQSQCLLVDAMGELIKIYEIASIAVVAGSFNEQVGGHNIFEPAFFGRPVIYGPWIFKQPGFHDLMQEHDAGIQIPEAQMQAELNTKLAELLDDPVKAQALGQKAKTLVQHTAGLSDNIVSDILVRLAHPN